MKLGIRFFISWLVSALVMFFLFYIWHGIFLNDFKRIQFPLSWFVTFAAITYLLVAAGSYLLFESSLLKRFRNIFMRGIVTGTIAGLSLFMMATIVHITLTKELTALHVLVNCVWQLSEQIVGSMVLVLFKIIILEPQLEEA